MKKPLSLRLCALLLFASALCAPVLAGQQTEQASAGGRAQSSAPELRALWVDAFHAGIRTREEAEQLVRDAKSANFNALIVQVRRRGDSLYANSLEPPMEEAPYAPGFDGLATVIELARAQGLQVHAWVNAMPIWRNQPPPANPAHIFNLRGLDRAGEESWLTASSTGERKFPVGYFLDPGHPDAAAHVAAVCAHIVRNYDIDGLHLDYIRYPETEARLPRGSDVGYNPVSVARFQRAAGRKDVPSPHDEQWVEWRRKQVTQLVRRVYLETKAIKPNIRVSAAVIAWGAPPRNLQEFTLAAPMQRIFQNWQGWMKEGILDLAVPMNYARETDPRVREWFNGWIAFEKKNKHGRELAIGIGAYLNDPSANLQQIQRARAAKGKRRADGVSFFSYANLAKRPEPPAAATAPTSLGQLPLVTRAAYLAETFSTPAAPPQPAWLARPNKGWVLGKATVGDRGADGAVVELRRKTWWPFTRTRRVEADGNGYFGFAELKPGAYVVKAKGGDPTRQVVQVQPGKVARAELRLR